MWILLHQQSEQRKFNSEAFVELPCEASTNTPSHRHPLAHLGQGFQAPESTLRCDDAGSRTHGIVTTRFHATNGCSQSFQITNPLCWTQTWITDESLHPYGTTITILRNGHAVTYQLPIQPLCWGPPCFPISISCLRASACQWATKLLKRPAAKFLKIVYF